VNFFFDNTFAPGLCRSLELVAAGGHHSKHLLEHYEGKDPGDMVWIVDVGAWTGWTMLSGDRRIATNPQKRAALLNCQCRIFFMPSGFPDLNRWEQASHFFRWFPKIADKAARPGRHVAFDVKMNGAIEPIC
jgi:hypothetical protein